MDATPADAESFADITNSRTRRACDQALKDFMPFAVTEAQEHFRIVMQTYILAWRHALEPQGVTERRSGTA